MTMVPIWRICPKCNKKYVWNPDVGKTQCPRCCKSVDLSRIIGIFLNDSALEKEMIK